MVGKEDSPTVNPLAPCHVATARKTFWRSASWSSSRTAQKNPTEEDINCSDPNVNNCADSYGPSRRFPAPLTPRSQQNSKARSCLPPLQPLSISRRSLDEWPKAGSDDVGEWPHPSTPSGNRGGGGERLKLDMSAIQRNPDRNGGLVKREKIAFFDKECSKVAEHIYLGGDVVARDRDILKQNGITHVLNCVGFVCPEYFKADFVYRTLWLQDSPTEDITSILYDVFDYFEDVREQCGRVFVHCCQGVSRSTSLVIAYLMWREGQSFEDAFQFVKAARGIADPNMGFACQLLQCQKRVHAFPLSPSSLLRMYRIAPHSPYDPLHLVPKMLNDPCPSALDSRGAFIVQIPSAIYVWVGRKCDAIMERDARGSVCQIVRYEKVHGPVVMVKEGDEPPFFWDAFSNILPLMDKASNGVALKATSSWKICSGERKVDLYDVDFEIFQKAIKGGVVPPFASAETEHETQLPARESCWSALRRKFAPSNMRDFVLAPKSILSRVYSDSMMLVHSPSNSPSLSTTSTSSSSTSSSPPYLSPDSISSESSTSSKCFSESSQDSPSTASCSLPVSSTVSNFSNLSLHPTKSFSQTISRNEGFIDINFSSRPQSQLTSSPAKKFVPSLAERRGSLSRTLKLPVVMDNCTDAKLPEVATKQKDGFRTNGSSCSSHEFLSDADTQDIFLTPHCDLEQPCLVLCDSEFGDVSCSGDPSTDHISEEDIESIVTSGLSNRGSECKEEQSHAVYRWPSLEKLSPLSRGDLDSRAAYAIFSPSSFLGKNRDAAVYFWLGRSFSSVNCEALIKSTDVDDVENINWSKVAGDFLLKLGLPKDTLVQILKEDQETEEFLSLLGSVTASKR